jgi:hypothetical protein
LRFEFAARVVFCGGHTVKNRDIQGDFQFPILGSPALRCVLKIIPKTFPRRMNWQASCEKAASFNAPQTIYTGPRGPDVGGIF